MAFPATSFQFCFSPLSQLIISNKNLSTVICHGRVVWGQKNGDANQSTQVSCKTNVVLSDSGQFIEILTLSLVKPPPTLHSLLHLFSTASICARWVISNSILQKCLNLTIYLVSTVKYVVHYLRLCQSRPGQFVVALRIFSPILQI